MLPFSEHPAHAPVGYGEIPKSCTIENRQNLIEHQLYATIQRKQPPVPPFTSDTPVARKGFNTMMSDRLKRLNNGEMAMPADLECPYGNNSAIIASKSSFGMGGQHGVIQGTSRCATLGRVKNLEMTEYQRQKFCNGSSNIVSKPRNAINVQFSQIYLALLLCLYYILVRSRIKKTDKSLAGS